MTLQELRDYTECLYDEYMMKTEGRGISWGEIAHIQSLNTKQLKALIAEMDGEA